MKCIKTKILAFVLFITFTVIGKAVVLHDPYSGVNWSTAGRHKANFHTHTTNSDGSNSPSEMIQEYVNKGYTVLAITDHNKATWPTEVISSFNQITMIQGNELSRHYHCNSLFSLFETNSSDIWQSLNGVRDVDGLIQINHPGRNGEKASWYIPLINEFDNAYSLEVYNGTDRYPEDRELWDELLITLMPSRNLWATGNDDAHSVTHVGFSYQVLLTPSGKRDRNSVRECLESGEYYVCHDPKRTGNCIPLNSLTISETEICISANCSEYQVVWISCGKEVHQGKTLSLSNPNLSRYVRAVITGHNGEKTLTQPIALNVNSKAMKVLTDFILD